MKTVEELNFLRNEIKTLNIKLAALSDEELTQVSGGEYVNLGRRDLEIPIPLDSTGLPPQRE